MITTFSIDNEGVLKSLNYTSRQYDSEVFTTDENGHITTSGSALTTLKATVSQTKGDKLTTNPHSYAKYGIASYDLVMTKGSTTLNPDEVTEFDSIKDESVSVSVLLSNIKNKAGEAIPDTLYFLAVEVIFVLGLLDEFLVLFEFFVFFLDLASGIFEMS